jgi:YVTN family beta-propeller protein
MNAMNRYVPILWCALVFLVPGIRLADIQEGSEQPLRLVQTIPMPNVKGRIDHMEVDVKGQRLFVAGLENGTVEVVDLRAGKWVRSIPGFKKPQGIVFVADLNKLFVASGDDGMLRVFRGDTLDLLDSIQLEMGPNRVVYEPNSRLVYVGYGGKDAGKDYGDVGVIDAKTDKHIADIKVTAHPSEILLNKSGTKLFVFISVANQLQVIDTSRQQVVSTWPVSSQHPGDAALDDVASRLFIGTRTPPEIIAMDSTSGREIAHLPTADGMDGVYFDALRKRVYVSGGRDLGSGFVYVYQQDADHYETLAKITTRGGAGTSFWSAELDRYYVAAPANEGEDAAVLVYASNEGHPQGQTAGPLPSGNDLKSPQAPLDFATYRTSIEPIFLKRREGGVRCYDCHSVLSTRLRLEPLSPGKSSWDEAQSRRNFAVVSRLVTPSAPLKSRLLLHPLAHDAGGDPAHTGGKFWASQNDPEWKMLAVWVGQPSFSAPAASRSAQDGTLDFQFFKTRVEPIFLKQRPGHARCYGCHILSNRSFHLEMLPSGSAEWTEDQSRRNFESAMQQVVPGDPTSSRLLIHPLAPEAGGDPFHSGGRQFKSQDDPDWLVMAEWVRFGRSVASDSSPALASLVYVTNSAGDTVDVIDTTTNRIVQVIRGIELPHGIAFAPDGTRVYISNESESVLDVVDRKSGEILRKVALSARPNNLAITKDGGRVLVGIRANPGLIDVIDTTSLTRTKSIPVDGSVHNVFVTPDGRYAVSGSIENEAATVVDLQSEQTVWEVKFDRPVRPMAFETNPDGSTNRIFVQLSGFNGFAVVDFAKRAEVARIKLPDYPGGFGIAEGRTGTPSHGIGIAPDGRSLWVNSTFANAVFKYSLPDLKLVAFAPLPEIHPPGHAPTGSVPEWITFTPDSKTVYISNSGAGSVSAIDTETLKEVTIIPVGEVPKRINTLVLH